MTIEPAGQHFPHLFAPITVGTMRLRNRVMLPPHASAIGNIYGTDDEAARNIAYFEERARSGVAWIASLSTHIRNHLIPGFDPTGVGAATTGFFRLPFFVERVQAFSDACHALGATVSVQCVHQGGMPHALRAPERPCHQPGPARHDPRRHRRVRQGVCRVGATVDARPGRRL